MKNSCQWFNSCISRHFVLQCLFLLLIMYDFFFSLVSLCNVIIIISYYYWYKLVHVLSLSTVFIYIYNYMYVCMYCMCMCVCVYMFFKRSNARLIDLVYFWSQVIIVWLQYEIMSINYRTNSGQADLSSYSNKPMPKTQLIKTSYFNSR